MEDIYSRFKIINEWSKRLKFFRYLPGYEGHASDTDRPALTLKYDGQDDLLQIFDDLKITYTRYKKGPPQPVPLKSYSSAEFSKFPSLITKTQWITQPENQVLDDVKIRVWCTADMMELTIRGSKENKYELAEADFENAEKLEKMFLKYSERIQT